MDGSTVSDEAVVMTNLFGHAGGEEWVAGFLVLAALRQSQLPNRVLEAGLRTVGGSTYQTWCEDFSERKLSAFAPMAAMLAGIITLLGASLWVAQSRWGPG